MREQAIVIRSPTVAECRRKALIQDRWHTAAMILAVAALAALVFWLLPQPHVPLPAKAEGAAVGSAPIARGTPVYAPGNCGKA